MLRLKANPSEVVGVQAHVCAQSLANCGVPPEKVKANFADPLTRAAAAVGRFNTALAKARADRNLSPEGRTTAEVEAAKALREALGELRRQEAQPLVESAAKRRQRLLSAGVLRRTERRDELSLQEARCAEIRQRLEAQDPLTWPAAFEQGSEEVRLAMLLDPFGRFVPKERADQYTEERSRAIDPVSWRELEEEEVIAWTLDTSLAAVEAALGTSEDAPMVEVEA